LKIEIMKNRKLTPKEKRQAKESPVLTAETIGLDPALYAAALRYLFDRPVPAANEQEWYWNIDEPEFVATPLEWTRIQTVLFANAGADLAPYSNQQVGMGLNHVMSNNAGNIDQRIARFIATVANDAELVNYARAAADGMVQ
jgi:hypothetical protein